MSETPKSEVWRTEEALGRPLDGRDPTKTIGVAFDDVLRTCAQLERDLAASESRERALREALRSLLYGGLDMELSMTPAGDKFLAVYPSGTISAARSTLAQEAKP